MTEIKMSGLDEMGLKDANSGVLFSGNIQGKRGDTFRACGKTWRINEVHKLAVSEVREMLPECMGIGKRKKGSGYVYFFVLKDSDLLYQGYISASGKKTEVG